MNRILAMVALIVVVVLALFFIPWGCGDLDLESLESGQQVHGFTVENLYVDAAGKAMGAGGGGRADMGQAGGRNPQAVPEAREAVLAELKSQLEGRTG